MLASVTEDSEHGQIVDLVEGTADMLVKILALEPSHGVAVSQRLKQMSGDALHVSDGSSCPAVHKREREGWIAAA